MRMLPAVLAAALLAIGPGCTGDDRSPDGDAGAPASDAAVDAGPCPANSGWPCSCDESSGGDCADGSDCLGIQGMETYGYYCAPECTGQGDSCPETGYPAYGLCALNDESEDRWWCVLVCELTEECPPDMVCLGAGQGISVCI